MYNTQQYKKLTTCHKVSLHSLMLEAVYICHLMPIVT